MGISILDMVLLRLRSLGIRADMAFPGQRYPVITQPVATVHIDRVDSAGQTVTVEVDVLCPGEMGGAQCELEALRVTKMLSQSGAVCVQNGCVYDGVTKTYSVGIFATYTGTTEADAYSIGPGFKVYLDEIFISNVVGFTAERYGESTLQFTMGENAPVGSSGGCGGWKITLEEQIPVGGYELGEGDEPFTLRLEKSTGYHETYSQCRWTSVMRTFNREGMRRIRTGIAVSMEESYSA